MDSAQNPQASQQCFLKLFQLGVGLGTVHMACNLSSQETKPGGPQAPGQLVSKTK